MPIFTDASTLTSDRVCYIQCAYTVQCTSVHCSAIRLDEHHHHVFSKLSVFISLLLFVVVVVWHHAVFIQLIHGSVGKGHASAATSVLMAFVLIDLSHMVPYLLTMTETYTKIVTCSLTTCTFVNWYRDTII